MVELLMMYTLRLINNSTIQQLIVNSFSPVLSSYLFTFYLFRKIHYLVSCQDTKRVDQQ